MFYQAAELIGTKMILNKFNAYIQLSDMVKVRDSGILPKLNGTTGELLWVDERTEAIMTYALCNFANVACMGYMVTVYSLFLL